MILMDNSFPDQFHAGYHWFPVVLFFSDADFVAWNVILLSFDDAGFDEYHA